ncbi:LlaJI family restriction endonuclease [Staphylococcus cohnii]|uniref:LlaJI family restriction endonuclease n=1 Tax=Staphylococcus cohnii TaxID=29382 RepID=UPI001CC97DE7|nr:LlaJI family restriction endonuclease [Staphylococcus cohnii]MBZ8173794.1 LlaJI family restriction endonuclease [Staphylococcus cohnii]
MENLFFKEGKPYKIEDLMNSFKLDYIKTRELIKNLLNSGVMRVSKSYSDLEILLSDISMDNSSLNIEKDAFYFFKYVGAIQTTNDYCILIYPKYMSIASIKKDLTNNFDKFKQLMDVIDKYENKKLQNVAIASDIDNIDDELLGIKLSILKDYYEYGLYSKEREEIKLNGDGKVLWNQTINRSEAYIFNNVPFYLDVFTLENALEENNIVQLIQRAIITEISVELDILLDVLDFDKVHLSETSLEELGSIEMLLNILEIELNNQFVTVRQETIKKMIAYLNNISNNSDGNVTLVGTRAFNMIWEDVCSEVYGNDLDKTFEELNLIVPDPEILNETLKSFVEKPMWHVEQQTPFVCGSPLKLDVLSVNSQNINIYDAKYYNISFHDKKVLGQPGINDITKQYLYELAFKKIINLNQLIVENQFIMPKDDFVEDGKVIAHVNLEMFNSLGLQPIGIVLRDCQTMFNQYL